MQIVFLPVVDQNVFTVKTYNGFSFAGLTVDRFFETEMASYLKEAFSFLSPEDILEIKALRLGPQGFFYHKGQKVLGIALLSNEQINAKFSAIMKAEPISELWSQVSSDVRPLLQSIIDPCLYEACSSDIAAFALDRLLDSEGMTAAQLGEEFGISEKKAIAGLANLAAKGFVQCWERAKRVYKITDLGMEELDQIGWTPFNNSQHTDETEPESLEELLRMNCEVHLSMFKPTGKAGLEGVIEAGLKDWSPVMIRRLYLKTTRSHPRMANLGISKHQSTSLLDKAAQALGVPRTEVLSFIQKEAFVKAMKEYVVKRFNYGDLTDTELEKQIMSAGLQ